MQIRPITADEVPAWCAAMQTGFLSGEGDVDAEVRRPGLDLDRTLGAFDGGQVVATYRSYSTEVTVSGTHDGTETARLVSGSAITAVSTTATHRRRGLLRDMMRQDLVATRDREETVAVLVAADYRIYGRFGFGPATDACRWQVQSKTAELSASGSLGSVTMVDRAAARSAVADLFERQRRRRAGDLAYTERFWDLDFGILRMPSWPEPKKVLSALAVDGDRQPIGLVRFRFEEEFQDNRPGGTVFVESFVAAAPAAETLLWAFLISLDWPDRVVAPLRPVDEVLPWLLVDGRQAAGDQASDHLWLRPMDIAKMLTARRYSAAVDCVLDVVDPLGLSGGRYRLDATPDGAMCRPTTETADVVLGLAGLGSISLGGRSLVTLRSAGRVEEVRPGTVAKLDMAFRAPQAPWCSAIF